MSDEVLPPAEGDLSIREPPLVLIPVAVLESQTVPESLVDFLAPANVVVLGYHVVPEQTPTEQASMQFEARAQAAVDDIAQNFSVAGREADTRVAFTHDRDKTIERVADEIGATAILLPNPVGGVDDVLVPIRGTFDVDRLADLVATVLADGSGAVTLWALSPEADSTEARQQADRAAETLVDRGLASDRIRTESTVVDAPVRAIVDRSPEFDIIVMGEGEQTILTGLLGDRAERIAEGAVAPVLVVRGRETD
jgi:nucleotide-binding universal stress UspA family protein